MEIYGSSGRDSDSIAPNADKDDFDTDNGSEKTDLRTEIERTIEALRTQTPTMTSPIGYSTAIAPTTLHRDPSGTTIRGQETNTGTPEDETREGLTGKIRSKHVNTEIRSKVGFELEPRLSKRIKTAKTVRKHGGVEYFLKISRLGNTPSPTSRRYPLPPFPRLKKDMPNHEWFP